MPTPQDYPAIDIVWYDAHDIEFGRRWVDPENLPVDREKDLLNYTRGYLTRETDCYYEISRDLAVEAIAAPIRIPKKCVKSVSIKRFKTKNLKKV